MKAVLGDPNAFVGLETLRTVFAEVVTILNSRPLTPVSDDPSDYEPLIFCSNGKTFLYPLGVLNVRIFTEGSNGEERNFWLIVFGHDGYESISPLCNNARSGYARKTT